MEYKFAQRVQNEPDSVWDANTRLRNQYKPIDLSSGYPDYEPQQFIKQAMADVALSNGMVHQYAPPSGNLKLRRTLSSLYSPLVDRKLDPQSEFLIIPGGFYSLYTCIMTFVDEGDEVIVFDPAFSAYESATRLAGGRIVSIALRLERSDNLRDDEQSDSTLLSSNQLKFNLDELKAAFSSRTKLLIVNTPHNPTGKVFTREEMETIATLCKQHDVICVADEVYEFCVSEPEKFVRMCTLEGMWERTITVASAGKIFGVTGWKLAWVYGTAKIIKALLRFHSSTICMTVNPIQEAVASIIEQSIQNDYFRLQQITYRQKRNTLVSHLLRIGFDPIVPDGGYFVAVDASKVLKQFKMTETKDGISPDQQLVHKLVQEKNVLALPISAFYSTAASHVYKNMLRFCYVKSDDTIEKAGQILSSFEKDN